MLWHIERITESLRTQTKCWQMKIISYSMDFHQTVMRPAYTNLIKGLIPSGPSNYSGTPVPDSLNCGLSNYPDECTWSKMFAYINLYKAPPDLQTPFNIPYSGSPVPKFPQQCEHLSTAFIRLCATFGGFKGRTLY